MLTARKDHYIIFGIIVFNLLFKLIHISGPSFWYDEIISVKDTLLDFGHIKHEAEWDKNPPFYHYALWIWSKFFGISELGLRSMSVMFSSITAGLIYYFSKKFNTQMVSLLITAIFTFHPFLYYFSQEARCFSLLIFLVTVDLIITYSLIQKANLAKAFILGVINFLIFYTHYLAGLILLFQFFYIAFVFRKKWIYYILIYLTPIILVLLRFTKKQYLVLFFSQEMSKEKSNVPISNIKYLLEALSELFVSHLVFCLYIIFIIIFLVRILKDTEKPFNKEVQFKIYVVLTPLACIFSLFVLGKWTNVFHERYLIYIMPLMVISFKTITENKKVFYFFASLILLLEFANLKFNQSRKMDYRFCANLARQIEMIEDVNILIQTHDVVNVFTYYYDKEIFKSKERMSHEYLATKGIYYISDITDLKELSFKDNRPILFFQSYQKAQDEQAINDYLKNEHYSRFSTNQIEGVKFSYLKK
ncbi:glycosyltransferase family 39 protein [Aurantibacillus circumpalustris]|uniref:glycosyltransferase family 39 protein n=1 Tax=Aurantibacillus circumpalustris TaxID=3036359 RepID=UPI00295A6C7F|nr:glycosyltransferase family 39 protein [Aurantibacillus circumpalustris]